MTTGTGSLDAWEFADRKNAAMQMNRSSNESLVAGCRHYLQQSTSRQRISGPPAHARHPQSASWAVTWNERATCLSIRHQDRSCSHGSTEFADRTSDALTCLEPRGRNFRSCSKGYRSWRPTTQTSIERFLKHHVRTLGLSPRPSRSFVPCGLREGFGGSAGRICLRCVGASEFRSCTMIPVPTRRRARGLSWRRATAGGVSAVAGLLTPDITIGTPARGRCLRDR
jgi:hypothetical protein